MAKIINPNRAALLLPTMHIVPRLGELVTTNDLIRCPDNWPVLNAMALAGDITLEFDPDPAPDAEKVYATDPVPEPAQLVDTPVYATDPVPVVADPVAETPTYATDPLPPEAEPSAAETPVYATDESAVVIAATEAAPAEPTTEPDMAITGPVDLPADAAPAKAKK